MNTVQEGFGMGEQLPGSYFNESNKYTWSGFKPLQKTLFPTVTGTSVVALKFSGGIIIAADTLASYGSLARYHGVSRMMKVNETTVIGAAGDYADFQFLKSVVEQQVIDEECLADGFSYSPKALFSWLTRVMYNRRSKMNPLWNTIVVGGMQDEQPFLGYVDKLGVAYEASSLASGFGAYLAQPLMRDALEKNPNMSEVEAREVIDRCLTVLFYRDARAGNRFEVAVVTKAGVQIDPARSSRDDWSIANLVRGYE